MTPASFEPTIDYVVTKIPRFTFEKFPGAEPLLTTSMKSVGEAMAIGRTFAESLQKALRSMETGLTGLDEIELADDPDAIRAALAKPSPDRLRIAAQAMRLGFPTRGHSGDHEIRSLVPRRNRSHRRDRKGRSRRTACRRTPQACAGSRRWASPMRASPI